jgi:hypothetical protein
VQQLGAVDSAVQSVTGSTDDAAAGFHAMGRSVLALNELSADAGIRVAYRDGVATFTVLDFAGDPLANASVTLDGMLTRTTDRLGTVQFTTSRGLHGLLVVAAGYASMELDVNV